MFPDLTAWLIGLIVVLGPGVLIYAMVALVVSEVRAHREEVR